jgi:hypothetical protein
LRVCRNYLDKRPELSSTAVNITYGKYFIHKTLPKYYSNLIEKRRDEIVTVKSA